MQECCIEDSFLQPAIIIHLNIYMVYQYGSPEVIKAYFQFIFEFQYYVWSGKFPCALGRLAISSGSLLLEASHPSCTSSKGWLQALSRMSWAIGLPLSHEKGSYPHVTHVPMIDHSCLYIYCKFHCKSRF